MRIRRSRSAIWGMVRCGLMLLVAVWALLVDVAHVIPSVGAEYAPFGDAVPLSKLGQMQFHRGQDTTYKRSSPIPQLRCVKGCEFEPAVVHCTNVKPRENKSKWRCETDLPRHLKFDETTIICEEGRLWQQGFEYPTDNKVLKGSCGLEYSLTRTGWSPLQGQHYKHYMAVAEEDEMKGWTASWMIVIGVVLYLINHNWRSFNFAGFQLLP
ncbi:hypothetical protein M758_7G010500 [Ceratodon purpureus]|nr:hypothetical protein M758_7G010500 [Ceratodon purpureus]